MVILYAKVDTKIGAQAASLLTGTSPWGDIFNTAPVGSTAGTVQSNDVGFREITKGRQKMVP